MYVAAVRPLLFKLSPSLAHAVAFAALAPVEYLRPLRAAVQSVAAPRREERLIVRVLGLELPNPLGLAAGFDKDARRPRALAALGFGHLELGTVTAQTQSPNPKPNLFRVPADRALINRLGFPNQGAHVVAARLRSRRSQLRVPIGVSIGKSRNVDIEDVDAVVQDYVASFDAVRVAADFVVVNVSSPNTKGLRTMQAAEHARALLGALATRAGGATHLLVKVSPDLDDAQLESLLAVVEEKALAGVVASNTTTTRDGLRTDAAKVGELGAGGLSGPPLRMRALRVVGRVRARLGPKPVIIGVGGVETSEHVLAFVRAGANLVQMYTGFIYEGPFAPRHIVRGLSAALEREGVRSIEELVGVGDAS